MYYMNRVSKSESEVIVNVGLAQDSYSATFLKEARTQYKL